MYPEEIKNRKNDNANNNKSNNVFKAEETLRRPPIDMSNILHKMRNWIQ